MYCVTASKHDNYEQFSHLLQFCIATFSNCLKKVVLPSQLMRSKTKTNCDLLVHIFPCFTQAICTAFPLCVNWFTGLSMFFSTGQRDNFGFGFLTLD